MRALVKVVPFEKRTAPNPFLCSLLNFFLSNLEMEQMRKKKEKISCFSKANNLLAPLPSSFGDKHLTSTSSLVCNILVVRNNRCIVCAIF